MFNFIPVLTPGYTTKIMKRKVVTSELKYSFRLRYLAQCAKRGSKPAWAALYSEVASKASVTPRRIQRLILTKVDEERTATDAELLAFARVLKTDVDTLSAEASAAILQQPQTQAI